MHNALSRLSNSKIFMAAVFITIGILASQIITKTVVFGSCVIGSSMYPTFEEGERVWINRLDEPERNDIVVVDTGVKYLIKRLVGMPGDTIQIKEGTVYINGNEYEEPYVSSKDYGSGIAYDPILLGEDEYFILGDNRVISNDSRNIGAVSKEDIIGVVMVWNLGFGSR